MNGSRTHEVLDAAAAAIDAALPALGGCVIHDGRFDAKEIAAFIQKAPAVRLACLGLAEGRDTGNGTCWWHDAKMVAYCVTVDQRTLRRGRAVATIAETVLRIVSGSRFGLAPEIVDEAGKPRAMNLFSREVRGRGLALWAIEWEQPVSLEILPTGSEPVPFETYHSDWLIDGQDIPEGPLPINDPDAANTVTLQGDQT